MLGVVLAALSAATFAFNNASARRVVLTGSVAQALAITVPIGVPMFLLAALTTGQLGALSHFSGAAIGLLALAGVLHFVVGRYGNFRAAQAIGANLSGPVIQLSLGITLILAVLVLKEPMTPLRILGIALLVSAPALMRNATPEATEPAETSLTKFQPRYAEGYAFSIMAPPPRSRCCCYGPASGAMPSRSRRNPRSGSPIPASRSASRRCSSTWPMRSRRFRW